MSVFPWLIAAWLFAVGVYGSVTSRHYVHLIGCLTVCNLSIALEHRLYAGRRSANFLRPSAWDARCRSGDAGAGADRHRRWRGGDRVAARHSAAGA